MSRSFRNLAYSIGLHAGLLFALLYFGARLRETPTLDERGVVVTLEKLKHDQQPVTDVARTGRGGNAPKQPIDLRPDFAKNRDGLPYGSASNSSGAQRKGGDPQAQELLAMDGQSLQAFDQLAILINGNLHYPQMLAENGVHGRATLDLYFDHEARIDESRSRFSGDNRWVRGLLVSAARKGLIAWYNDIGGRLKREKFRNQHFRADFIITYTSTRSSDLQKEVEGSYHMVRRSLVQTCLNPTLGGVDVACVAMRVTGAISARLSEKYKIRYQALKDRLEALDDIDLRGINDALTRQS